MKSETSWRRRVKPRRNSSSADMSGQATTKSGGVPLRAMTCGCEGQPLTALSHERTGTGQSTGQAPMGRRRQDFWGTCSAIHRESARPVPSSATLTDHERSKRKSMFTKLRAPTTDRLLVAACRQGHPCRSCAHEDLWSQGSRHGSTPPACVVGASPKTRAVVLLYWLRKVACFLIFTSITKNSVRSVFC